MTQDYPLGRATSSRSALQYFNIYNYIATADGKAWLQQFFWYESYLQTSI